MTSTVCRLELPSCHFLFGCRVIEYSFLQHLQNVSARLWTCLHCLLWMSLESEFPQGTNAAFVFGFNSRAGESTASVSGSADTRKRRLAFIIAVTSAIKVPRTSCMFCEHSTLHNMVSKIWHATPLILSLALTVRWVGKVEVPSTSLIRKVGFYFCIFCV